MGQYPDVIVIGGGISGTAAAYELARRGVSVTLLERGEIGAMASGWTLAGVRQSGRHVAELPLARAAIRRWEHLDAELGADVEYRQDGNLRLALSEDDVPVIRSVVGDGKAIGLPIEYLDSADAVRQIAPALTPMLHGASFCATDGHANNHLAVRAFAEAAARHGATIRTGVHVEALGVENGRATSVVTNGGVIETGTVIVAAGVYTPRLVSPLGLDLPIRVTLCPVLQTVSTGPMLGPVLGVADGGFAARQEASGQLRMTGHAEAWDGDEHTATDTMPTMRQIEETTRAALKIMPGLEDVRLQRSWGGLIDRTPDALPVIERVPAYEGLVIAAGFSGHGFGIGPVTGEILADLATGAAPAFDLSAFTLGRFAEGAYEAAALQLHG